MHTIMPVGGTAKSHPNRQASLTATSNTLFLEAATGLLFHINSQILHTVILPVFVCIAYFLTPPFLSATALMRFPTMALLFAFSTTCCLQIQKTFAHFVHRSWQVQHRLSHQRTLTMKQKLLPCSMTVVLLRRTSFLAVLRSATQHISTTCRYSLTDRWILQDLFWCNRLSFNGCQSSDQ